MSTTIEEEGSIISEGSHVTGFRIKHDNFWTTLIFYDFFDYFCAWTYESEYIGECKLSIVLLHL